MGCVHQTVSSCNIYSNCKLQSATTSLPSCLLNLVRTLLGSISKGFISINILYKHHISSSLSSFDIYRIIYMKHYTWTSLLYIYRFINMFVFCKGLYYLIYLTLHISIFNFPSRSIIITHKIFSI